MKLLPSEPMLSRLNGAMARIIQTSDGEILAEYLTSRVQTLSAVTVGGVREARECDIMEGRRLEAAVLLGLRIIPQSEDT